MVANETESCNSSACANASDLIVGFRDSIFGGFTAALQMLFDWLVVGQVTPHNPAAAVRSPVSAKVVTRGFCNDLGGSSAEPLTASDDATCRLRRRC